MAPDVDFIERAFDPPCGGFAAAVAEAVLPSLIDPSLAPAGGHVLSIYAQYAPVTLRSSSWDEARQPLLHAVLDTLDRYMPGVRSLVVAAEVLTPADLERDWGLTGGHIHHGELALDQLFTMRPLWAGPGIERQRRPAVWIQHQAWADWRVGRQRGPRILART
jgi:phytoene dehydrogenase-like protein